MTDHFDLTDDEFYNQMDSCEFRKKHFSHLAHLRLAWIHIHRHGATRAEGTISIQIKRYVAHIGKGDKFNLTLTIASVRIMDSFIRQSQSDSFITLIADFPELQHSFRTVIARHYTDGIYTSIAAKTNFVEPDVAPFS